MTQRSASTANAVDPWTDLIERAWAGNPYRKMVPFDPLDVRYGKVVRFVQYCAQ